MLAGMDTNGMNHKTPGGRGPRPESSVWAVIGITLAVMFTIAGLAVVGGTVLLYVGLSRRAATSA
jgi:hypothetical protein